MKFFILLPLLLQLAACGHYAHYSPQEFEAAQAENVERFASTSRQVQAAVNVAAGCESPGPNNIAGSTAVGSVDNGHVSLQAQHTCQSVNGGGLRGSPPRVHLPRRHSHRFSPRRGSGW